MTENSPRPDRDCLIGRPHTTGTLNFGDLQGEHSYSGQQA